MARAWRLAARCSVQGVLLAAAVGLIVVVLAVRAGAPTATWLASILAVTLVVFALHSAWLLGEGLSSFAQAVPVDAEVDANPTGEAELRWPALSLTVEAEAGILRDPKLEAHAGGQPFEGDVDQARDLAEEALASLGVQPRDADAET